MHFICITNQSNIDPNNVPLASLIAQEKDQVDVNFLNRSNFNNNAYRNNFGSNNYKPYPPNNGNSYGNSYNPNNNMSYDLENVLKEFISSQKAFNKTVEEKLEKLDRLVSKVEDLAHDVEILKIRTTPLQDKPTESLIALSIQINNNERMLARLHARWAREEEEARIAEMNRKTVKVYTIQTTNDDPPSLLKDY